MQVGRGEGERVGLVCAGDGSLLVLKEGSLNVVWFVVS